MKETDLYEPIRSYWEQQGFVVKGEIGPIDVFASNGEEEIAVELKTSITLKLIYQAMNRQSLAHRVYVGIPMEAKKSHAKEMKHFLELLTKLGIGLLLVEQDSVRCLLEAKGNVLRPSKKKQQMRKKIHQEFSTTLNHLNVGGTQGSKMTSYHADALEIAAYLLGHPEALVKEIVQETRVTRASSILQKNYYAWFERSTRGRYHMNPDKIDEVRRELSSE